MLTLNQIKSFYPPSLHNFDRFILREYLQYKILQIIFDSKFGNKFSFLGGTALRIVYGNTRFSEDLDFDNFNVDGDTFISLGEIIKDLLEKNGYVVELEVINKSAYHCYIKFPKLLYDEGLSAYPLEKILIQLDTESQGFIFESQKFLLNKFDVFTEILCTPQDILLSQKFHAILNRKRNKGRDFFDVMFLLSLNTMPNYQYLEQKLGIKNNKNLCERILDHCAKISMEGMAKDVAPFLFNPTDTKKIILFPQYIKQAKL